MAVPAPLAYWKLDESSGNAADATGNGKTLVNTGLSYVTGKINNGIGAATGSNNLKITDAISLTSAGDHSWNFWFKTPSWTGGFVVDNNEATNGTRVLFRQNTGGKIGLYVTGNELLSSALSTNTLYMVTGEKSGSTFELFINNVSQGTVSNGSSTNFSNSLWVNNADPSGGAPSNSVVDELGIWNSVLGATNRGILYIS
jgi:hypothetical protein